MHITPASNPITIADLIFTYPAAGVIVASPATEPVSTSTKFTFFLTICAYMHHETIPAASPIAVFTNAVAAKTPACNAPPALNPNHPNHKSPAPSAAAIRLLGDISLFSMFLFPKNSTAANAANPAVVWITAPPAKSTKPRFAKNPCPHTQ